jgi:hypothetical protein
MKRFAILFAVALASVFSGCDRSTTPSTAVAPSSFAAGSVAITAGPLAVSFANDCASVGLLTTDLRVVVSSARAGLLVDDVTLHLIDGTNVGGPGVTFPQSDLNTQFVDTIVRGGSSRTFVLRPTFRCSLSTPRSIRGDVGVVDAAGVRGVMTAAVSLQ